MLSSTTGPEVTEHKKKHYPVLRNEHKLTPPKTDNGTAKKAQITLIRALEDEADVRQYIEKNMFIKLINFEVVEPDTLQNPIVVRTEYQETGFREEYENVSQINSPADLLAEMTQTLRQICDGKCGIVPQVQGRIVKDGCCK